MSETMKTKALQTWEREGYTYYLFKNQCMPGYCIEKYNSDNEYIDTIIGATFYSLVYYFNHKEIRHENHKDF